MANTNYVKFRRGNPDAFRALLEANAAELDTLYFIYEDEDSTGELYLGSKLIAGGSSIEGALNLASLQDVLIGANLNGNDCLIYDVNANDGAGAWVNKPIADILPVFVGTNGESGSVAGLVPAATGDNPNLFLRSDGTWAEIVVASEALVLQTIVASGESREAAIARVISGKTINKGDVVVLKELIAGEHYQYIAYTYNGEAWVAMDGNYDANNIYFNNDLVLTYTFGRYAPDSSGKVIVPAKGINLQALLEDAYSLETKTGLKTANPTASITSTTKYYEVGSTGTVDVTVSLSADGEYKYGYATAPTDGVEGDTATAIKNNKSTGVVVDTSKDAPYEVTFNGSAVSPKTSKGATFTLAPAAQTAKTEMTAYGTVHHTAGGAPVSNLGKIYPAQAIGAGSVSSGANAKIRWYIPMYHGFTYGDGAIADPAAISASEVKALPTKITGESAYNATKTTSATATKAWRQYFLAVPADYGWEMSNAKDGNNIDCTVRQAADVTITYGSGDTAVDVVYNVFYINNAADYGTLKITWTLA